MNEQVTLSAYSDEIRNLIRSERNDEAISLCQHILHYYPMHLDTYRQMAEASLEKGDLDATQELFRRVLSADPENVLAYAGLAIVFEQQHQPQEAVSHMERAYELGPANLEIRRGLMRLYSETEGKPRSRLKLTSGGLARLYVAEGLFPQAIQEFRSLSAASPNRYDLQVALAETLYRAGRGHEASELAQKLTETLPYCLKANLILGALLQESDEEEAKPYLDRAKAVDPTNQVAQDLLGARSPLKPEQAQLPRYEPGVEVAAPGKETGSETESIPDWITQEASSDKVETEPSSSEAQVESALFSEKWVEELEARLTEPTAEPVKTEEPELEVHAPPPALEAATAEPSAETLPTLEAPPAEPQPEPPAADLPPWLHEEPAPSPADQSSSTPVAEPATTSSLPPWLSELDESLSTSPVLDTQSESQSPVASLPVETTDIPKPAEVETPLPEWAALGIEQVSAVPDVTPPAADIAAPSWATAISEAQVVEEQAPSGDEDSVLPPWLSEAPAPSKPASPALQAEPVDAEPEIRNEDLPDWLRPPLTHAAAVDEPAPESKDLVAQPDKAASADVIASQEQTFELPDWLQVPGQAAQPSESEPGSTAHARELAVPRAETAETSTQVEVQPPAPVTPSVAQDAPVEQAHVEAAPVVEAAAPTIQAAPAESGAPAQPPASRQAVPPIEVERTAPEQLQAFAARRRRAIKGAAQIEVARAFRNANQLGEALGEYDQIVQNSPNLVGEVITDLEELIRRPDVPLNAHRILGDAYTRADRLADALTQYRFVLDRVS